MNSTRSIPPSTVAFTIMALLFALGPILAKQEALAANLYGSGLGLGGYCGYCGYGLHKHFYPYYGGYGFHNRYPYYGDYPFELPFP
jgi:hypothetical protein